MFATSAGCNSWSKYAQRVHRMLTDAERAHYAERFQPYVRGTSGQFMYHLKGETTAPHLQQLGNCSDPSAPNSNRRMRRTKRINFWCASSHNNSTDRDCRNLPESGAADTRHRNQDWLACRCPPT